MHELHQTTLERSCYLKDQGFNVIEVRECDVKRELKQNEERESYFDNFDVVDPLEPRYRFAKDPR